MSAQTIERNDVVSNDSIYIDLINPFYAPLEINLKAKDSVRSFIKFKAYGLLKKDDTLKHALVIPKHRITDSTKATITDFVSFDGSFGDPNTVHDEDHLYELPYKKGMRSKIIQSFGGKFSHNKISSRYAVDFGLEIGDTITAARSGRVFL